MDKRVFLTGADGFIGSHLAESLVSKGYKVKALVYYNSFGRWGWLDSLPKEIQSQLEVVSGDIRDPHQMRKYCSNVDYVFNLAALIGIPYSYVAPASYVETNINGTLNLLEASLESKVEKFVQTSTSEVYGTARVVPISEDHPLRGQSPYAASKIGADQMAMSFFDSFKLPVAILRPFNTYGPRQSLRAVIPTIIAQLAQENSTIQLGSVDTLRDFTYVKDAVEGFVAIAESEKSIGEVINIGSGYEISIGETAKVISKIMERPVEIHQDKNRIRPKGSEVERLLANTQRAQKILNWNPKYSGNLENFKMGLRETISWFRQTENLKHYKADLYNV